MLVNHDRLVQFYEYILVTEEGDIAVEAGGDKGNKDNNENTTTKRTHNKILLLLPTWNWNYMVLLQMIHSITGTRRGSLGASFVSTD